MFARFFLPSSLDAPSHAPERIGFGLNSSAKGLYAGRENLVAKGGHLWCVRYLIMKNTTARYSLKETKKKVARGEGRTRADAPEGAPVSEDFWKRARIVMPRGKTSVHLRVDSDVFEWFKKRGEGHLTRMNAVLRSYVDAQKG